MRQRRDVFRRSDALPQKPQSVAARGAGAGGGHQTTISRICPRSNRRALVVRRDEKFGVKAASVTQVFREPVAPNVAKRGVAAASAFTNFSQLAFAPGESLSARERDRTHESLPSTASTVLATR